MIHSIRRRVVVVKEPAIRCRQLRRPSLPLVSGGDENRAGDTKTKGRADKTLSFHLEPATSVTGNTGINMPSFESYFTGKPLVRISFSYTDTNMTRKAGRKSETVSITPDQRSRLDRLQADEQMKAASIFAEAAGWHSNWPGQET